MAKNHHLEEPITNNGVEDAIDIIPVTTFLLISLARAVHSNRLTAGKTIFAKRIIVCVSPLMKSKVSLKILINSVWSIPWRGSWRIDRQIDRTFPACICWSLLKFGSCNLYRLIQTSSPWIVTSSDTGEPFYAIQIRETTVSVYSPALVYSSSVMIEVNLSQSMSSANKFYVKKMLLIICRVNS